MVDRIGSYKLGKRREVTESYFVCDAADERTGRLLSMKVVTAALDAEARTRLRREARAIMAVEHPNVVMVVDFDDTGDTPFIAYEALQGPTLDTLAKTKGALPSEVHAAIFVQLAATLRALHDKNIVHGAVSPQHVHVEHDGRVVLTHFSLAVAEGAADGTLAARGTAILTTPLFVPPELLATGGERSTATDVYSLAMCMTCAWLGGLPVDASAPDAAALIRSRRFKRAGDARPDVPHQLTVLVDRIVHTDTPASRPTIAVLHEAFQSQAKKHGAPEATVKAWLGPLAQDKGGDVERLLAAGDHDGALIAATGGRYTKLEPLGKGNMGRVTKAHDTRLVRDVAIKTILDGTGDMDAVMRFHREARAMGRLHHPNIVEVIDYSGRAAPLPYLVLEYLDAATLRSVLDLTRLSEVVALSVLHGLCEALVVVHDQGLVHRDIKPENIFVCGDGRVVLADFGIVRGVTGQDSKTFVRASTQAIGSPAFASPEQVFTPDELTGASDMFSLGSLLHAMLAGDSPFAQGNPVETVRALQDDRKAPLPEKTSAFVQRLRDQLLAVRPEARPNAAEAAAMIASELGRRSVLDRRYTIRVFLGEEREDTRLSQLVERTAPSGEHTVVTSADRTQVTGQTQVTTAPSSKAARSSTAPIEGKRRGPGLLIAGSLLLSIALIVTVVLVLRTKRRTKPVIAIAASAPVIEPRVELPVPPPPEKPPELPVIPQPPPPEKPPDVPKPKVVSNKPAQLRIVTKPWAKVTIDGELKGTTPFVPVQQLAPGRHTVLLDNPAFKKQMLTIDLAGGETKELKVELQK